MSHSTSTLSQSPLCFLTQSPCTGSRGPCAFAYTGNTFFGKSKSPRCEIKIAGATKRNISILAGPRHTAPPRGIAESSKRDASGTTQPGGTAAATGNARLGMVTRQQQIVRRAARRPARIGLVPGHGSQTRIPISMYWQISGLRNKAQCRQTQTCRRDPSTASKATTTERTRTEASGA